MDEDKHNYDESESVIIGSLIVIRSDCNNVEIIGKEEGGGEMSGLRMSKS